MDNRYSDFSEDKEGNKRGKSNENELITLPFLSTSRLSKLSWNKTGKAKVHESCNKRLSVIEQIKKEKYKGISTLGLTKL